MKLFSEENGKKVVYVQNYDLKNIKNEYKPIPFTILAKIKNSNIYKIDEKQNYAYTKFEREAEIEYFSNCDWIIDLVNNYSLSIKNLEKKGQIEEANLNLAIEEYKNATKKSDNIKIIERNKDIALKKYNNIKHKMNSYRDLIYIKNGKKDLIFPNIIKEEKLLLHKDNYSVYNLINSLVLMIKKDDNTKIQSIPFELVNEVMDILASQSKFITKYKYSTSISEDGKNIIITILFDKEEKKNNLNFTYINPNPHINTKKENNISSFHRILKQLKKFNIF